MANQVADQVKRTIGQDKRRASGDVWDTATNEMPPDEPPECQWCPVCQAARAARMSGPGLGERLAGAGGVLASVVADAFTAFDKAMKTQDQNHSSERAAVTPPRPAPPDRGKTLNDPRHRRRCRWHEGRGGLVDEGGRIVAKLKRSTPAASPPQTEQAIADVVTELLARHQVVAIGLGAAGSLTATARPCCSRRTWPGVTSR